jgi:WD40 repeat-containing protein SMU1
MSLRPPQSAAGELSINSVMLFPQNVEQIVVCNRSSTVYVMTLQGQVAHLSLACLVLLL